MKLLLARDSQISAIGPSRFVPVTQVEFLLCKADLS